MGCAERPRSRNQKEPMHGQGNMDQAVSRWGSLARGQGEKLERMGTKGKECKLDMQFDLVLSKL